MQGGCLAHERVRGPAQLSKTQLCLPLTAHHLQLCVCWLCRACTLPTVALGLLLRLLSLPRERSQL